MNRKSFAIIGVLTAVVIGAAVSLWTRPQVVAPGITIVTPVAGARVPAGSVTVSVQVSNFTLVAPGGVDAPGQGHVHYYLDVAIPADPGKPATTPPGTYKSRPETSVIWDGIPPGRHTFGVQLVNNSHTPVYPLVTATVTVTVY